MGLFPAKYRNIFFKEYNKFPYQKLTGRNILLYTGKIIKYDENSDYDSKKDYFFDCDCKYPLWKEIKKLI